MKGRVDEGYSRATHVHSQSPTRYRITPQHTREVVSPQRSNLVLASDIPNVELCVLVRDGLDVEADGRDRGDVLVELELVEDCYSHRSQYVMFLWC